MSLDSFTRSSRLFAEKKKNAFFSERIDAQSEYLSLKDVERISKIFEKQQREVYKSYLVFLILGFRKKKFNVNTIVTLFLFQGPKLAREISVITKEPPIHYARRMALNNANIASPPNNHDFMFYRDREQAEYDLEQRRPHKIQKNIFKSNLPMYSIATYTVDIVPFNSKARLRLSSPSGKADVLEGQGVKAFESDPRSLWTRGFLSIRRLAAQAVICE